MIKDAYIILLYTSMLILSVYAMIFDDIIIGCIGYYEGCNFICRFVYMFVHKNPLHLMLNAIMLFKINQFLGRIFVNDAHNEKRKIRYVSYIICVAATFFSESSLPTIGLSGYTSSKYGIALSLVDWRDVVFAVSVFCFYNLIMFVFGNFNCTLHIICFFSGLIFGFVREYKYR